MSAHPRHRVDSYDRDTPVPNVGSHWIWERGNPNAEERITVTDVRWNGEEWFVQSFNRSRPNPQPYWNDLSRFWEAVSPLPASAISR